MELRTSMAPLDFTIILKDAPTGEWIALSKAQDRIVATARTLEGALVSAREMGESSPVMMKLPPVGALVL
jgi:hypothetical protein